MKNQICYRFIFLGLCLLLSLTSFAQQLKVRPNDTTTLHLMVEPLQTNFGAFYGVDAGRKNVGAFNTLLGFGAGAQNRAGESNTFVGEIAGEANRAGNNNSYFGRGTARLSKGSENTAIGSEAGALNTLGNNNTFIGRSAGVGSTGSDNVFLGRQAGSGETGNHKLYIENSGATSTGALLYGEFDNDYLRANGRMDVYSTSPSAPGVSGFKSYPPSTYSDIPGIVGQNNVDDYYGIGVEGKGGWIGVRGLVVGTGGGVYYSLFGESNGTNSGANYGVYGSAYNSNLNIGVYGTASGGSASFAGWFEGDTYVSGNMGIGTQDYAAGYKLSVDGKIAAEEILVDLSGDWPDYVFQHDYNLPSLHDLKISILDHGHLPGVPSADHVKENGILLGDMNKVLLEKIEELTLYIIQQDERINALERKVQNEK